MLALLHSKIAQSLATWLAILTAVFAVIGRFIPEWFGGLTWPQLTLISFGAALTSVIVLSLSAFLIGAGGALYRRYKPLPSSAVESAAGMASYDDSELRGLIRGLADRMNRHIQDQGEKNAEQAQLMSRLRTITSSYVAKERSKVLESWLRQMSELIPVPTGPLETLREDVGVRARALLRARGPQEHAIRMFEAHRRELESLGFPSRELSELIEAEQNRIRGDATYLTILPEDEKFFWRTGEEKRDWHLKNAALTAQVKFFATMLGNLREEGDVLRRLKNG